MGIDCVFALQLVDVMHLAKGKTSAVMLGRQALSVKPGHRKHFRRGLAARNMSPNYNEYVQEDGFAETFLEKLGFPEMQSMDFSEYEGCDIVHDLNDPPPQHLRNKFDVIIDGGTIEHVFNTPQALDTVFHMLAPGGIFISINGMIGWAGHGFYQFSPELVWRYWLDARGCEVINCRAVPVDPSMDVVEVSDTGKAGSRFRARGLKGRWYLYYTIRKPIGANSAEQIKKASQGDYAVQWNAAAGADPDST